MARVNLRCASCGFHFSVTDTQASKPEGVRCPSCLAPVGISGPVEGGPARKPVRVLNGGQDTGGLRLKLGIVVGLGVLVLGVAAAVFFTGRPTPPPPPPPVAQKKPVARQDDKPATARKTGPKPGSAPKADETPTPEPTPDAPALVSDAAPSQAGISLLPGELLNSLREDLAALKDWHQNLAMSAPEKLRVNALLATGKGSPEEVEFLRGILNGPRFRAVKEEAMLIRESRARLEAEALEGLPVDKVTMTDGRILQGRILEETDTQVRLEKKISSSSTTVSPLPKAAIKSVERDKGIGTDFKTRWEAAKKSGPPALVGLLAWCKENTLTLQASLAAYAILVDDPGRTEARQAAELPPDPVAHMLKAGQEGGPIPYEGRSWVPSELKAKLLRDGYVLLDGRWMKKAQEPRTFTVPSLFRYENQKEKPVQIAGTLAQEVGSTWTVVQGGPKADPTPKRLFYAAGLMTVNATRKNNENTRDADVIVFEDKATPEAGTVMRGEVTITVPLNAPILEASVMTSAEVKSGGKIAVSCVIDGRPTPLYDCAAKESGIHPLPDTIRGKKEVRLVVELRGQASYAKKTETKRIKGGKKDTDKVIERAQDMTFHQLVPEYSALLFPSNANTFDVFRLTATVGESAPAIDKLFENAPDVIKK